MDKNIITSATLTEMAGLAIQMDDTKTLKEITEYVQVQIELATLEAKKFNLYTKLMEKHDGKI